VSYLRVLSEPEVHAILTRLLTSPASQKELGAELAMSSGTLSRRMKELESLALVHRERSHGPYELVFRRQVWLVLQAAADLSRDVTEAAAAGAAARAKDLRRRGLQVNDGEAKEHGS
jgi:DNA-binding MarR family transcriptional regulator